MVVNRKMVEQNTLVANGKKKSKAGFFFTFWCTRKRRKLYGLNLCAIILREEGLFCVCVRGEVMYIRNLRNISLNAVRLFTFHPNTVKIQTRAI